MTPTARLRGDFYRVVSEAIDDLLEHGFDSQHRVDDWLRRLQTAARLALVPENVLDRALRDALATTYRRVIGGLERRHKGIDAYTLSSIKPKLHAELDRRILASAQLIRLNRDASIQRTLQRFAGWASSVPAGGTEVTQRQEVRKNVRRGIAALPYEERRVIIDQGHKLAATINEVVATDGGAIAGVWRSRWREPGYNYREDHKERDGHIYVLRDNWAMRKGFMKLAGAQYTDQITAPGEEVFCRCGMEHLYTLRDLPAKMVTERGRLALKEARASIGLHAPAYGELTT